MVMFLPGEIWYIIRESLTEPIDIINLLRASRTSQGGFIQREFYYKPGFHWVLFNAVRHNYVKLAENLIIFEEMKLDTRWKREVENWSRIKIYVDDKPIRLTRQEWIDLYPDRVDEINEHIFIETKQEKQELHDFMFHEFRYEIGTMLIKMATDKNYEQMIRMLEQHEPLYDYPW